MAEDKLTLEQVIEQAVAEAMKPYAAGHIPVGRDAHLWIGRRCADAVAAAVTNEFHLDQAEELQAIFNLRWEADMRAIQRWQAANPGRDYLVWPDRADLVVWLLELDAARAMLLKEELQRYATGDNKTDYGRGWNCGLEEAETIVERIVGKCESRAFEALTDARAVILHELDYDEDWDDGRLRKALAKIDEVLGTRTEQA